jgi:hypothetical protein
MGAGMPHVTSVQTDASGNSYAVLSNGMMRPLGIQSGSFTQKTPVYKGEVAKQVQIGNAAGKNAASDLPLSKTEVAEDTAANQKLQSTLDRAISVANNVKKYATPTATGIIGQATGALGGSSRRTLMQQVDTLNAQLALTMAEAERQAKNSKGNTAGQIRNYQEFLARAHQVGAIDPDASAQAIQQQADMIINNINTLKQQTTQQFRAKMSATPGAVAPAAQASGWSNFRVSQ